MSVETVLVTGGPGCLGAVLLQHLARLGSYSLIAALRQERIDLPQSIRRFENEGLSAETDWYPALIHVDAVIHTTARVHIMDESATDPPAEFRRINVDATLNFAQQVAQASVKCIIFIGSIKVKGEGAQPGCAFAADDLPTPVDKLKAELGLKKLVTTSAMAVVIIRPMLVCGAGIKANFLSMVRWLQRGVPLPFGAVYNRRSLVSLDNLIVPIEICLDRSGAANEIFLVSDGKDVSITQLIRKITGTLNKSGMLLPVGAMKTAAGFIGKNRRFLDWVPPISLERCLNSTIKPFLET